MIIDLILDRKGGVKYVANDFYLELMQYAETWPDICDPIIKAMDAGSEQDVISELCKYVKEQQWPEVICNYISAVKWLDDDAEDGLKVVVKYDAVDMMGKHYTERFVTWQPVPNPADTDEQVMAPVTAPLRVALDMGWQVWRKLTIEVPEAGVNLVCEPRDKDSAKQLQQLLEQAQRDGKPIRTESQAKMIISKTLDAAK